MHSTRRSSLWGTVKKNTLTIGLLILIIILIVVGDYRYQKIEEKNNTLNTIINNQINTIEELQSKNSDLNIYITELEKEKKQLENTIEESQYVYNITSKERDMLAKLVFLEANTESLECQKAVASVVINRLINGNFGDTLKQVIYSEGQFTPAYLIYKTTPEKNNYAAVDYVLKNGVTIPTYVMYFCTGGHFQWNGYKGYKKIDHTYFGYMIKDKK